MKVSVPRLRPLRLRTFFFIVAELTLDEVRRFLLAHAHDVSNKADAVAAFACLLAKVDALAAALLMNSPWGHCERTGAAAVYGAFAAHTRRLFLQLKVKHSSNLLDVRKVADFIERKKL